MPELKDSYMTDLDLDSVPDPVEPSFTVEGDDDAPPPTKTVKKAPEPAVQVEEGVEDVEVVDDTPPEDRNRKPLGEDPDDIPEDELAEYSAQVKKRISKLRHGFHDERRAKERELREKEEAIRFAQQVFSENQRLKQMYTEGERIFGSTLLTAAQGQLDAAKRKVKDAYEAGDSDALVAAQEEMTEAKYRVEQAKTSQTRQTPLQDSNSQQQSVQRVQQPPVQQPQPDPLAARWQQDNPWFGSDDEMTSLALGVHKKLVEKGVDPRTREYYEQINARVRQIFPDYFRVEDGTSQSPPAKRPASVVAPQTRTTAPKKIVLSKSQVAIAKRLGISVEEYARQTALLENRNG